MIAKLDGIWEILQFNFKPFRRLSSSCCSWCGQEHTLGVGNFSRVITHKEAGNFGFRHLLGILMLTDEGKPGFASCGKGLQGCVVVNASAEISERELNKNLHNSAYKELSQEM